MLWQAGKLTKEKITVDDIDQAPTSLETVGATVESSRYFSLLNKFSTVTVEKDKLELQVASLENKLKTNEILNSLIEPYAHKAFVYMCVYSAGRWPD